MYRMSGVFFGYIRPSRNLSIDTALGETRDSVAERTRMEAVKACEDVVLRRKNDGMDDIWWSLDDHLEIFVCLFRMFWMTTPSFFL